LENRHSQIFFIVACLFLSALSIWVLLHDLPLLMTSNTEKQIFFKLRLPLLLTALIVGSSLAVSSATLQVLLKNPLADPGIIGISSGASLFAAVFLLTGVSLHNSFATYGLPIACFFGALASTFLIYRVSKQYYGLSGTGVILAGIAMSTVSGAIIAWLYFFSDAQSLRNLTFWLMGSLHQADLMLSVIGGVLCIAGLWVVLPSGEQLNWLYFGDNSAKIKGLNVLRFFNIQLLGCAFLVAIAVSLAGSVAFVGLLVPHLLRNFMGHDNRFILPASAICGAIIMLLVVLVSELFGGVAVPVSMLTASIGGPIFLYSLLKSTQK
jgi:ABC-type Fe3+-siderophore transport system permease subunit